MIVFHGSVDVVQNPDINHSYRPLDFGKGFYVITRINGRAIAREYYKTKGTMVARVVELKNMGYALA